MSVIHKIFPEKPFSFSRLNRYVAIRKGVKVLKRSDKTFYYWCDRHSTRGVDISIENDYIEVRNTVLSNRPDYELTNILTTNILSFTNGAIINENDEKCSPIVWNNESITKQEITDCEVIHLLSREEEIAIFGPIRDVFFGGRLYNKFKTFKGEQLRDNMFALILQINYNLPKYDDCHIMLVGKTDDDQNKMIVLSNDTDCIIGRYDKIMLYTSGDPIMITNEILNTILPIRWSLIDEYTIIAPVLDQSDWNKLLFDAHKHDQWYSFIVSPRPTTPPFLWVQDNLLQQ